ncbi:hypothetical protein AGABI2DRAFT_119282 [Agaricus bisporus var. bisporus H97]|uniref:hypothetical protein n=1 Tax=Agaricus bisporus var. bisporus (strain H97 / ATCC MYA-4626 / FGSC 10389) TaxID=936046 RepID=UPI00029F5684|nr:hypothetical protein AGABI2DRAFT_119282 [Agaricus bisporus var. bisporus H97]EKV45605.1 hypothetical protein AGABI2DRAFT_119282 [Agaricus bisporus var. bisporus H97]
MTRQFWYNRIHRLCEKHASPPEEELEEYSTAELKQWTMRRIHARSTSPVKLQIRTGRDPSMLRFHENTFLIPGGRWLLKPHSNLTIYFVDLDSSNLKLHPLLDPKKDNPCVSNHKTVGYRILIDHKAPRLTFRFQGSLVDSRRSGDLPFTYAYIYQVDLIGHGASATLVAQIIATFRCRERDTGFTHAFNNRYFAQGRGDYLLTEPAVEIFDYRQALGCFNYPTLMDSHTLPLSEDCSTHLEFINEDVLAIYCDVTDTYHIFNIESPTSFKLLHEIKLPVLPFDFSRTYWTPEASLMTFTSPTFSTLIQRNMERIYGLVIPHDSKLRPWTVEIGRFIGSKKGYFTFKPGIFISLLYNSETGTNSRLVHEWDYTCESSCSEPTPLSPLEQEVDQFWLPSAFDEDTGRSVSFQSHKLRVADFASL